MIESKPKMSSSVFGIEQRRHEVIAAADRPSGLNDRQQDMLDRVQEQGFVSVEGLAQHFAVTAQTIRRDINALCGAGLLRRYHGGAGLPSSVENVHYQARRVLLPEAKARIGAAIAERIPEKASVFITLGTTTEAVALALRQHRGLRVITNNLNVATAMADGPDCEVIVAGGVVRQRDRGITGEATIDFVNQFKVDYAVLGISGIEADGTLLDFDYHEVRVVQAIMRNARSTLLGADHSKFGRNAMVRVADLGEIDELYTDAEPPAYVRRALNEYGGRLVVSDAPAGGERSLDSGSRSGMFETEH
jgi:DeoR family glycerol-3-phosphate regulon repressor